MGPVGPSGMDGDRGPRGYVGKTGSSGHDGIPGINGVPGNRGLSGRPGRTGKPGKSGKDGKPGENYRVNEEMVEELLAKIEELQYEFGILNQNFQELNNSISTSGHSEIITVQELTPDESLMWQTVDSFDSGLSRGLENEENFEAQFAHNEN
jgi:hypothetical protein